MRLLGKTAFLLAVAMSAIASNETATGEMPDSLRIAAVQMPICDEIASNLARILRGVEEAANAQARVVLFPETALSGFDRESVENVDWEKLDDAMAKIAESAQHHGIYVLYGTATKSAAARPYNSAILIGPDGREVTRYHKLGPEAWFEPGDHLALFEIDSVPCTMMICHDERYPEVVRLPVLSGARVCFYISYEVNALPSALRKAEGYRSQLIARAVENGIWVCQANGVGPLDETGAQSLGHSRIVSPDGVVQVEAPALVDKMILADIQPNDADRRNALESLELLPVKQWWKEGLEFVERDERSTSENPR